MLVSSAAGRASTLDNGSQLTVTPRHVEQKELFRNKSTTVGILWDVISWIKRVGDHRSSEYNANPISSAK